MLSSEGDLLDRCALCIKQRLLQHGLVLPLQNTSPFSGQSVASFYIAVEHIYFVKILLWVKVSLTEEGVGGDDNTTFRIQAVIVLSLVHPAYTNIP